MNLVKTEMIEMTKEESEVFDKVANMCLRIRDHAESPVLKDLTSDIGHDLLDLLVNYAIIK